MKETQQVYIGPMEFPVVVEADGTVRGFGFPNCRRHEVNLDRDGDGGGLIDTPDGRGSIYPLRLCRWFLIPS